MACCASRSCGGATTGGLCNSFRPSYAVECRNVWMVVLVRHREQILTPQEAPALATELHGRSGDSDSGSDGLEAQATYQSPGEDGWRAIWYEDAARKQVHRDLVVAGMERARQQGKRIGRPSMNERPEFEAIRRGGAAHRIGRAFQKSSCQRTGHRLCHPQAPPPGLGTPTPSHLFHFR